MTGTSDWEFKGGAGVLRGFGWGTMTLRAAAVQWHLGNRVYLRFNSAVGLTSKATDLAPDVGVVFSIPTR